MQIQISWLLKKPTDLDLHCLQRQDISGFSRTRVKLIWYQCVMFMYRLPGKKAEVMFTMNDAQVNQEVPGQPTVVGKDHQFLLTGVGNQNLMVYSQQPGMLLSHWKHVRNPWVWTSFSNTRQIVHFDSEVFPSVLNVKELRSWKSRQIWIVLQDE